MSLKFIVDLDAKVGALPLLNRGLEALARGLLRVDPKLKYTMGTLSLLAKTVGHTINAVLDLKDALGALGRWSGGKIAGFLHDAGAFALGYASVEGIKALGEGLIHVTEGLINTASSAERTHRAFDVLFGDKIGGALEEQIEAFAHFTAVDDDNLKHIVLQLKQAGVPRIETEWRGLLQTITDLAALDVGEGTQAQKIDALGEAFARMARHGEVSARILDALHISSQAFWNDLGKRLGMSAAEVEKRAQAGKIAVSDLNNELGQLVYKATGKPVGTIGFKEGAGPEAALDRFKRIPDELAKSLAGSPALDKLAGALDRIAGAFDPQSENGRRIISSLEQFIDAISTALGRVDIEKLSTTLIGLFQKLPPLINATTHATIGLANALVRILPDRPAAVGSAEDLSRRSAIQQEKTAHPWIAGATKWLHDAIGGNDIEASRLADQAASGFGKALAPQGMEAGQKFSNWVEAGAKEGLEVHSPSKVFERLGQASGVGYERGLAGSSPTLSAPSRALDVGLGDVSRGGPVSLSVPITVNWSGGSDSDGADALAERLRDILPGQLRDAFEVFRTELGAA